jgi:serine/threonine protein kinase
VTPERWQRIGKLYQSALPLETVERAEFLARACEGDPVLQQEVVALLSADRSAGDVLGPAAFEFGLRMLMPNPPESTATGSAADSRDKLIGTTLDDCYVVEARLGQGGIGVVYRARTRNLFDKPVAVKVLLEESLKDLWARRKFLQEIEALAKLDHPGIVRIINAGELSDGSSYFVMEFIDGVSLRDPILAKPSGMEFKHAAAIIKEIGAALGFIHEHQIYHRDLKPENIMLQRLSRGDEMVKIVDFGIAKVKASVVAPSTATGAGTAGTVLYMSPEQLRGQRVNALSDIYSFAAIAYEIVTGRRPFNPDTATHLGEMQAQGVRVKPTDLRPHLPPRAEEIILKSLSFDPHLRHQNAADFGDLLAAALISHGETAPPAGPPAARTSHHVVSPDLHLSPPNAGAKSTLLMGMTSPPPETAFPSLPTLERKLKSPRWPAAIGILLLLIVLAGAAFLINRGSGLLFTGSPTIPSTTTVVSERSLSYFLTVQEMRGGKLFGPPFQSRGQDTVFESGDKFQMNFSSEQAGYLYVFNEGQNRDSSVFTIIYPSPGNNAESERIPANQPIRTSWNTFGGAPGVEQFWLAWSASPVPELEDARAAAFKNQIGAVTDATLLLKTKDLLTKYQGADAENPTNEVVRLRAKGDLLVRLVGLKHF